MHYTIKIFLLTLAATLLVLFDTTFTWLFTPFLVGLLLFLTFKVLVWATLRKTTLLASITTPKGVLATTLILLIALSVGNYLIYSPWWQAQRFARQLVLDLEHYKKEHGSYPDQLSGLFDESTLPVLLIHRQFYHRRADSYLIEFQYACPPGTLCMQVFMYSPECGESLECNLDRENSRSRSQLTVSGQPHIGS